ncbi:hypothetical protein J1G44_06450 [Cellulomonas sp. zg-ZUI199]|uniref:LppX_LprAFG lipoprotein n=1 Tax=Cellulomonas wangleii TaxID=2816956 RepID=A0ABX8D425_9CELL|nr:hypothetical protein [Cellulomonas wangleii]MBO0923837.1 hypothetical protein [Cellulomonas wangleii]MBO0924119.1 hypothetical protein [Cellulomonas wangleii]QVI62144.1 hypothetical protein KG103_17295 [Cellulomonas wangleii]
MLSRHRAVVVPSLVALLCALPACSSAPADVAASPSATAAATPTPEEAVGGTLTKDDFVRTITDAFTAVGSYDFTVVLGTDGSLGEVSGSMHLGEVPSYDMTMAMVGMEMRMRAVDGTGYVSLGELTGGKFLAVDPSDASDPFAAAFADSVNQADPSMGLKEHEAAIVSVTAVGEPTDVDGVQVRTYEVLVDPRKMPERMADLESSLPPGQEIPETLAYTYLITADGLVREVSYEILGIEGRMTTSNWGAAAPVTAPGPDEITTQEALGG